MNREVSGQEGLGKIHLPERTISYPGGGKVQLAHTGIVTATLLRSRNISVQEAEKSNPDYMPLVVNDDPNAKRDLVWASISHNERVASGASIQINRVFGTVGNTAAGVFTALAVGANGVPTGGTTITKTVTDKSLGLLAQSVSTQEFTTIGLSRAAGAPGNLGAAPGSLDGTQSVDIVKSFSVSGTGNVFASGLFDSTTVAGSWLYCEDNFSSAANVVSSDTLVVTWTVTF